MCAFAKWLSVCRVRSSLLVAILTTAVLAGSLGIATDSSAVELPQYQWEPVLTLPVDEFVAIYVSGINQNGDVVGRGRKMASVDFWDPDLEEWEPGERVRNAGVLYLNSLDYLEDVANWGTLVDRREWPVTTLTDGRLMRFPIITDKDGQAWEITRVADINVSGVMVGHASSYLYCPEDERYVEDSSGPILITIDAEEGKLSVVDLRPQLEALQSDIQWANVGSLWAVAINDREDIAGQYRWLDSLHSRGFYAHPGENSVVDIGDLGRDGQSVIVRAMNNSGEITGQAFDHKMRAFRWSLETGMQHVGFLRNRHDVSSAYDINQSGQIVGECQVGNQDTDRHAFRYTDGLGMADLGIPRRGVSVNNAGDVLIRGNDDCLHVYTDATGRFALEPQIIDLPTDFGYFSAFGDTDAVISDAGVIFTQHGLADGTVELVILRPIDDSPPGNGEEPGEPGLGPFFSTDTPMTIADAHPRQGARDTVSTITISDTGTDVDSLLLLVDIGHDAPGQLSGELVDPDGNGFVLFVQGALEEDGLLDFDVDLLRSLDGAWKLILRDHVRGVTGTLNGWAIIGLVEPSL